MFIYFWEKERQSARGRGAEREGDTETEIVSRLWAVSTEPDAGLELTDEPKSDAQLTEHPGIPKLSFFCLLTYFERDRVWVGEGQRARERETSKQALEPDTGLNTMNCEIVTWTKTKGRTLSQLSHPRALKLSFFQFFFFSYISQQKSWKVLKYPRPRFSN